MFTLPVSTADQEQDRRKFPRIQLRLPVRYRTEGHAEWHTGTSRDVSAAGILFETDQRVDVAGRILVTLTVPGDNAPKQLGGFVTRAELIDHGSAYLIGVKFIELNETDRQHIGAALGQSDIIGLLKQAAQTGASDVHLSANHPPLLRIAGKLTALRPEIIPGSDLKHMVYTLMDDHQRKTFERELELDFSLAIESTLRYRVNVHSQRGNVEATFRRIESSVRTLEELGLPKALEQLVDLHEGLVLVVGPAGSGKTTAMAAMVDHVNRSRESVVITLEHPIEYVHEYKRSVIKQREVGVDTRSFVMGVREAMRQDPDVIVVGDINDEATMRAAIEAAQTGHLVLAAFSAPDCTQALSRAVQWFPTERHSEVWRYLADVLRATVGLRLLPRADGKGLVAATELLMVTPKVADLIREREIGQIPFMLQTGEQGNHTFDSSLERLLKDGLIAQDVYARARSPK